MFLRPRDDDGGRPADKRTNGAAPSLLCPTGREIVVRAGEVENLKDRYVRGVCMPPPPPM